jgi:dTDP-4-amino-4,6-dideoxygalactose transaminase
MAKKELAINGGPQTWTKGFPAWPQFNPKTGKKVLEILESGKVNYWTGPVGMQFEAAWAKWLGTKNAISVSNGTAALHVALTALGIGSGDEVICTSYSFIASSFCALQLVRCPYS